MLIPPDNFGLVEAGVYRCSKLVADHFPFLETLNLKLLVLLDAAKPPKTLKTFLFDNNVELHNLGGLKIAHRSKDSGSDKLDTPATTPEVPLELPKLKNDLWMILEKNSIVAALELVLDAANHNVLVVDASLTFVGILRKIQKWNFNSIVTEYRTYTGNSSKSNYNVEVFLELVELELVPYEVDQCLRKREEELKADRPDLVKLHSMLRHRGSIDEGMATGDDDDQAEDYEDDMDEDILLASPQIPANLLKLAEQRRSDDPSLPSTLPDYRRDSTVSSACSRSNSMELAYTMHRRKSLVELRYVRSNNRFRDPSFAPLDLPGRRMSFETSLRHFRIDRERATADEVQRVKERFGYRYYRAGVLGVPDVAAIKVRLPAEHKLAEWFVQGRNFWEHYTST